MTPPRLTPEEMAEALELARAVVRSGSAPLSPILARALVQVAEENEDMRNGIHVLGAGTVKRDRSLNVCWLHGGAVHVHELERLLAAYPAAPPRETPNDE